MHFWFLRWFSQDACMADDHGMLQCSQTLAIRAELNRSPGATSSRDSQHTSGSSHFQTKTWWHHPRHNPPRPLQAQPGLFQSPRDGFGEYILVKGTRRGGMRMRGTWILPKDQKYVAPWAWQVQQQQHVPFCLNISHDHFRNWCPHPNCSWPLTT